MRWLVRGDIDGFFGLALDNLVQLLLIDALCRGVIGMPAELLYGRVLPGAAVSLLVGNLFYAWQAHRLATATGRDDVCALPYGINTVSLFGHVFLIMLPAKLVAEAAGAADPARVAWQAGLVACLGSGVIELVCAPFAERVRRATPRAALLSTLAGIALTFIALGFLFRAFARPIVGLTTLGIVLLTYFGHVRFKGGLPGGFVAVAVGTALAWITGIAPVGAEPVSTGFQLPIPTLGDLLTGLGGGHLLPYVSVIVPMGLFNVIGSLQNIESAEAAGDRYPTAPSLAVNGLGSRAACRPLPDDDLHRIRAGRRWARAGYSVLTAMIDAAGTARLRPGPSRSTPGWRVLWIGLVMTAQAFRRQRARRRVVACSPASPRGARSRRNGLRAAAHGRARRPAVLTEPDRRVPRSGTWIHGAFALEQGFASRRRCCRSDRLHHRARFRRPRSGAGARCAGVRPHAFLSLHAGRHRDLAHARLGVGRRLRDHGRRARAGAGADGSWRRTLMDDLVRRAVAVDEDNRSLGATIRREGGATFVHDRSLPQIHDLNHVAACACPTPPASTHSWPASRPSTPATAIARSSSTPRRRPNSRRASCSTDTTTSKRPS